MRYIKYKRVYCVWIYICKEAHYSVYFTTDCIFDFNEQSKYVHCHILPDVYSGYSL